MAEFDQLWNYDRPADTESKFVELLSAAERSADSGYKAELLTQLARAQGLQGKFEEANATLDQVEAMLGQEHMTVAKIRYLLERGRVVNSSGAPPTLARAFFIEAYQVAEAEGEESYAVDAAHMMAIVHTDAAKKMEWNLKALEMAERSPKARHWLGSLYNNIGWAYADAGEHEKALEMFQRALAFREEQGKPVPIRIAKWCVAKMLRLLGRTEEALSIQKSLLSMVTSPDEEGGFIHEELGECLLALGHTDESRPHFAQAHKLLSKQTRLAETEPARMKRLAELGRPPR